MCKISVKHTNEQYIMMKTQEQMCQQEQYNTTLEEQLRLEQEHENKMRQQEQYKQIHEQYTTPEEELQAHFLHMQKTQQMQERNLRNQQLQQNTEQYKRSERPTVRSCCRLYDTCTWAKWVCPVRASLKSGLTSYINPLSPVPSHNIPATTFYPSSTSTLDTLPNSRVRTCATTLTSTGRLSPCPCACTFACSY